MILVDSNVLLDLVTDDPLWAGWSQQQLDLASAQEELAINDIVYAELSVGYARMEPLDAMIRSAGLITAAISRPALFLAGKAFQFRAIAPQVAAGPVYCPISSLAPTRLSPAPYWKEAKGLLAELEGV